MLCDVIAATTLGRPLNDTGKRTHATPVRSRLRNPAPNENKYNATRDKKVEGREKDLLVY